jgi:hypothetical protein
VKPIKFDDFLKKGTILHGFAMADCWRAFMAKRGFWAEELRHGGHLLARRVT